MGTRRWIIEVAYDLVVDAPDDLDEREVERAVDEWVPQSPYVIEDHLRDAGLVAVEIATARVSASPDARATP